MQTCKGRRFTNLLAVTAIIGLLLFGGCEGSETHKTVTDTVKTAAGNEAVKKGDEIKRQLKEITKQQAEKQTAGSAGETAPAKESVQAD